MDESKFPKKDSKGKDITPRITSPIVNTEEVKDSAFKKAAKMFFSEDIDHVTDSIVDEFVKPRATSFGMDLIKKTKEFLYNSFTDFVGSLFFGSRNPNGGSYTSYSKPYRSNYNYNSYSYNYNGYNDPDDYYWYNGNYYKGNNQPPETVRHDIVRERPIKDAGKAQEVIDRLRYVIRSTKDHYVAVADYYVAVGAKVDALDYEWVWVGPMLDGCKPIYTRKGYILNLPHPVPRP